MSEQDLEDMKKRLKEIEEEAGALREMQAKVEREMGAAQGLQSFSLCVYISLYSLHKDCWIYMSLYLVSGDVSFTTTTNWDSGDLYVFVSYKAGFLALVLDSSDYSLILVEKKSLVVCSILSWNPTNVCRG